MKRAECHRPVTDWWNIVKICSKKSLDVKKFKLHACYNVSYIRDNLNIHSKKKISNILTKLTEQILLHKDVQDPANIWCWSIQSSTWPIFLFNVILTRSRTRENSGELRVFSGRAGLRALSSSVKGGRFLMKRYLKKISTNFTQHLLRI